MKNLFFILFSLPVLCFGQAPAASSGNLFFYVEITTAVLALLSFLMCVYLFSQIGGLKGKLDQLLRADKIRQDTESIKKQRQESEATAINTPFNTFNVEKTVLPEIAVKNSSDKGNAGFVTLSVWERAFDELNMRILVLEDPKLGKQLFDEEKSVVADTISVVAEDIAQERLRYAKMPGTDGSFNEDDFLSQQNGEQIYELNLKENEGTFSISSSADAQIYALSDVGYYLKNACEYHTQADRNSRIVTLTPGKVFKQGSQWIISDKAKIEFA